MVVVPFVDIPSDVVIDIQSNLFFYNPFSYLNANVIQPRCHLYDNRTALPHRHDFKKGCAV